MTRDEFLNILPPLANSYKPAPHVLDKVKNVDLLMIIGPSGVGKTAIINQLGVFYVIVDTTRAPRPEEKDGKDFNFRQDYNQIVNEIKAGEFVQLVVGVSGDLYATQTAAYPDSGRAAMPVIAEAVPRFRSLGFQNTESFFITPPSYVEWMRRLSSHNLSQDHLERRYAEARRSLHLSLLDNETHFILNDDINGAVKQIKDMLQGNIDFELEGLARSIALNLSDILE
jgi:guanylate kinase